MQTEDLYRYRVVLSYDSETGQTIAEVPALDIVDYGADASEALSSVQDDDCLSPGVPDAGG